MLSVITNSRWLVEGNQFAEAQFVPENSIWLFPVTFLILMCLEINKKRKLYNLILVVSII